MITRAAIMLNGELWAGGDKERHHHIIHTITTCGKRAHRGVQGFLTDDGRFLTREEAAQEALRCGQVEVGKANIIHIFNGHTLFSEDLW